jgi:hypothetical protein
LDVYEKEGKKNLTPTEDSHVQKILKLHDIHTHLPANFAALGPDLFNASGNLAKTAAEQARRENMG